MHTSFFISVILMRKLSYYVQRFRYYSIAEISSFYIDFFYLIHNGRIIHRMV